MREHPLGEISIDHVRRKRQPETQLHIRAWGARGTTVVGLEKRRLRGQGHDGTVGGTMESDSEKLVCFPWTNRITIHHRKYLQAQWKARRE